MDRIVVVGASLAGLTAADALRVQGYEGAITIVGGEPHAPYTRPPLSKGVLTGAEPPETVRLRPPEDGIELRTGTLAVALDRAQRVVELDGGERLPYDGLVIATGGRARSLAAPDHAGEHRLRTLDDCLALQAAFAARPRVLIVGAGFLGMEIASTCRVLGLDVTIVDREPPLRRVLGEYLGRLITEAALDAGVRIKVAPGDARLLGSPVHGVRLGDGTVERGDVVISAVGDVPNSEWLGLRGPVVVDDRCRVAPGIVAAGDVAAVGGRRTPHWASAVDQARVAAAALLHGDAAPALKSVPYYWTEGYGLEIKVCGPLPVQGEPVVLDGSVHEREAVLRWPGAAATLNHRMPLGKLKRLAAPVEAIVA